MSKPKKLINGKPIKKIKFKDLEFPLTIKTDGFMSQWCCKCGARHVWHFIVLRDKKEENDEIYIDIFRDFKGEELRRFYNRTIKKLGLKNEGLPRKNIGDKNE